MSGKKRVGKEKINDDITKFVVSGLTIVMTATIVIYFLMAVVNKNYLINFTLDSLVGVIALVILIRMMMAKYKLVKEYDGVKDYLLLDLLSILLCILIKIAFKSPFDLSLLILVITYFISKKKFEKNLFI